MPLLLFGLLLLACTVVDIVWTTLGTHGGGPVSRHVTSGLWRMALALHRRRSNHRALSFAGSIVLAFTVVTWILLMWSGWVLVYSSDPASLADAHSRVPADLTARIYFVAYTVSSMGNGDFQPNGPGWQLVTAIAALSGLASLTLSITFLIAVLGAVVQKRALGAYISDMGGTPRAMLERSWTGEAFEPALEHHLVQVMTVLHLYSEQHLAYPVLHYFHSEQKRTAATVRIAALAELVLLLAEGVVPAQRLPRMVTDPLRDALRGFAGIIREEFVVSGEGLPPAPSLEPLRELGIPTVDEDTFRESVAREAKLRRFLAGLLRADGWAWEELEKRE